MKRGAEVIAEGLGFDDVLLIPRRSNIQSRHSGEISTRTRLTNTGLELNIPIISANMDIVTESRMAIEMALLGGIGIIHRFNTPEQQAAEVRKVKERMRYIEDNPPVVHGDATVGQVLELLESRKRGYVMVHEGTYEGVIAGMATSRDFLAASDLNQPIRSVMIPAEEIIGARQGITREQSVAIMKSKRIQKLPVFDNDGKLIGVYTLKDDYYYSHYPNAAIDDLGRLLIGAAIGVHDDDIQRAQLLQEAECDVLILDIAHGELDYTQKMLDRLHKENLGVPIIAGNIATADGSQYVADSGANGVKVGVGPGFVCETRDVAGVGIPQVTAIMWAAAGLEQAKSDIPIIADGGIRKPGDVAKALAAGAEAVMVGSMLAGTEESPGEPIFQDGIQKKMVRGMASAGAFEKRVSIGGGGGNSNSSQRVPEGRTTFVNFKGKAAKVVNELVGGALSGMSYVGAHDIVELHERGAFIKGNPAEPIQRKSGI